MKSITRLSGEKIVVSFSGGRSSAVMAKICLDTYAKDNDVIVVFSNTGCEHPATLDFVKACDDDWGFNTVWLEAVFSPTFGEGAAPKVVDYETASRNGEPFKGFVLKHAVNNNGLLACSSTLKRDLINRYLRSIGWNNPLIAIGIRADEIDRIRSNPRVIYPLLEAGFTREMVNAYMEKSGHDLQIPSDAYGNCVWCWKKSDRKLYTLAQESSESFAFPLWIESVVPEIKMFRHNRTVQDVMNDSQTHKYEKYADSRQMNIWQFLDIDKPHSSCEESCEAF